MKFMPDNLLLQPYESSFSTTARLLRVNFMPDNMLLQLHQSSPAGYCIAACEKGFILNSFKCSIAFIEKDYSKVGHVKTLSFPT